ncbi:MAG: flippase-like domain-containing protein [Chloroflexi bacterium]|nr:flippase-like domain-containing protein [Chloroflexota bacterium]
MTTDSMRTRLAAKLPMRVLQVAFGIAVSIVALTFALRGVDWPVAREALRDANYAYLIPAVMAMITVLLLRAIRWRLLFQPEPGLKLPRVFGVLNVGYMVNNLFPFQIGDLVRAYLLAQLEDMKKSQTFTTVVIERLVDVLVLFGLLMVLAPFVSIPARAAIPVAIVAGIVVVVGAAMLGMAGQRGWVLQLFDSLLRFVPGRFHDNFRKMADSTLDTLSVLSKPRILGLVVGWSVAAWLTTALVLYFVMIAFDLGLPFSAAIFVVVMTSFGYFVPSSPGALGVYHAISIEALVTVFDVDRGLAASYSMVAYVVFYVPPVLIGLLFLWRERFSLRQLTALASQQGSEDEVGLVGNLPDEAERSV